MTTGAKERMFREMREALNTCKADYEVFVQTASVEDLNALREALVTDGITGFGVNFIDHELAARVTE